MIRFAELPELCSNLSPCCASFSEYTIRIVDSLRGSPNSEGMLPGLWIHRDFLRSRTLFAPISIA
jgi:hypothetical protein